MPVNGQPQRADVVVVGDRAEPLLPGRWAAPEIPINGRTLAQAVRYNSVLGARFVILTNGLRHYCCEYRDAWIFPVIDRHFLQRFQFPSRRFPADFSALISPAGF